MGFAYSFARQPSDAILQFRKTLEIEANFSMAHSRLGFGNKEQQQDFAKAREEYRFALAQNPDDSFLLAMLARADADWRHNLLREEHCANWKRVHNGNLSIKLSWP